MTSHRNDAECCMQLPLTKAQMMPLFCSDATILSRFPKSFTFGCSGGEARDPCLPVGYSRAAPAGTVVGSGNFEECRAIAKGLIAGQCQDELCPIGDSMPVELQGTACLAAHHPEQRVCTTVLVSWCINLFLSVECVW